MRSPYGTHFEDRLVVDTNDAPGGVIAHFTDGNEELIHANRHALNIFECESADDLLEMTQGSFRNLVLKEDIDAAEHSIWGQVRQYGGYDHVYYRARTKTGRVVTLSEYGKLIENARNGRSVFYSLIAEVTPEASVDWLTGLPGMRRFHRLARMGSQALFNFGEQPVVVALDIMGMKSYNVRYGRDAGDRLLLAFADVLRRHFGSEAASRFAEDHFYAYATAEGVEQRVMAAFDDFASLGIERVPPVRAGLYACDPTDDIVSVGFDRAKVACDLDRKTWTSHFTWFTNEMRSAEQLRAHVLESLDQAIEEGWIRPYYQAVVRSSTGDICNEEALARWMDPEFGALFPDQFIPDLDEAGLLHKLDLHIVDCVIADMRTKQQHGVPIVPVSINFSLRDLTQLKLAKELAHRADAAGLPRSLIRVELTESVASSNPAFLRKQMQALHEAGFEVWMDDFGSGYSSLNTLQEFDFDLIKLDMGFLRSAEVEKSRVILAGVVQAAAKLGVGTLTEGVETQEQAEFLASIGCDMLQGYFYAKPCDLQTIMGHKDQGNDMPREAFEEARYWNDVSLVSFTDLTEREGADADWVPLSESPIAVLEERRGTWRILRANDAYIEFLTNVGILTEPYSNLRPMSVPSRAFDLEFYVAADRSRHSRAWERTFGRIEYGSGYQFYVRYLASSREAKAFMVSAAPTMLGSGLGTYGDVPVGYAVFRVVLNDAGDEVVDAEYVYASNLYCEWGGFTQDEIIGKSFLEVAHDASRMWFPYCYQAAVLGKSLHDIVFSPETGHWLSFNIAPSLIEGCCVYAFTLADDERHVREEMRMGLDTSELIIRMADALNTETNYDVAMNRLLEEMSQVIHPDRLYVFERGEHSTSNTFEWCAEGVVPQRDTLQNLDNSEFDTWEELLKREPVVIIPDVEDLRQTDERKHWQLTRQGITHLLAVPFYDGDRLLGYLGADNYMLEEDLDSVRLLQTVASFVSARIVNRRLMNALEQMGTTDELTGMRNRRGIDAAVSAYLAAHEGEPYALALMDVDDFKTVNDVYGHDVGDAGLCAIARCVEEAFPTGSIVGRNGGDEFMALVPGDESWLMGEYLKSLLSIDLSRSAQNTECSLTLSAGYVLVPQQAPNLRAAYTMADAALYAAKLSGKSKLFRYNPTMKMQYRSQTGFTPRDVVESLPGAIVAHRPGDGEILFANEEMVELFECDDVNDLIAYTGGTFGGVMHADDRERVLATTDQADFVEFRIVTKWGNVRHVANTGRQVTVAGVGDVRYELLVAVD
ncbi:MAG: EAL domain-containing protein [Coriobacteriales bacterium]|nr:EAL domain-containing protein [Coriobacteriales bacterium]